MTMPIPVICDRCRAEGVAGQAQFADFGDLLDFEPVPLQVKRIDGFSPEAQRAYVAALSILGSAHRAAKAIGKSATGAQRLCTLPGSEGFRRACERAKAISLQKGKLRLADSLGAVAAAEVRGPPPESLPGEEEPAGSDDARIELLAGIVRNHLLKLKQERRCRLEGRIAEADFYVRQITCLEVALDLVSEDGWKFLYDCRRGEHDLTLIAETDMSRLLDAARREHWEAAGDPPRPEHPPRHLLVEHDGFSTEPLEATWGGQALSHEEQRRIFAERHAQDAAAQVEWEAEARRDHERRREAPPGMDEGEHRRPAGGRSRSGGGLGRPACDLEVDRTDVTNSVRDGPAPEDRHNGANDGDGCAQPSPHKETDK
jgi:hypothetical protein